jgi:hypothetical protein
MAPSLKTVAAIAGRPKSFKYGSSVGLSDSGCAEWTAEGARTRIVTNPDSEFSQVNLLACPLKAGGRPCTTDAFEVGPNFMEQDD